MNILIYLIGILIIVLIIIITNNIDKFSNQNTDFYIVSFAHNCCSEAQKHLEGNGMKYGAKKVYSLNLDTLEAPEDVKNVIKNNSRGAGFWCWKPYAMDQISKLVSEDSIIIYMDSGSFFTKEVDNILNFINENNILLLKHVGQPNSKWSKMNAVQKIFNNIINWCKEVGQKEILVASFVGVKNNKVGKKLIAEWKELMSPENINLYDDSPSDIPNCDDFNESRHDQHILSLMVYKNYTNLINKFPYEGDEKIGWIRHQLINGKDRKD